MQQNPLSIQLTLSSLSTTTKWYDNVFSFANSKQQLFFQERVRARLWRMVIIQCHISFYFILYITIVALVCIAFGIVFLTPVCMLSWSCTHFTFLLWIYWLYINWLEVIALELLTNYSEKSSSLSTVLMTDLWISIIIIISNESAVIVSIRRQGCVSWLVWICRYCTFIGVGF